MRRSPRLAGNAAAGNIADAHLADVYDSSDSVSDASTVATEDDALATDVDPSAHVPIPTNAAQNTATPSLGLDSRARAVSIQHRDSVEPAVRPFLIQCWRLALYLGLKLVICTVWLVRYGLPPKWYRPLLLGVVYKSWPDPELMFLSFCFATIFSWLLILVLKIWSMLVWVYEFLFVPSPTAGATFDEVLKSTELEMYNMTVLSTKIFDWVHHFRTACPRLEGKGWDVARMAIDESDKDRALAECHKYCTLVSTGANSLEASAVRIDNMFESVRAQLLVVNGHLSQPIILSWFSTHPLLVALDQTRAQIEKDLVALIEGIDAAVLPLEGTRPSRHNLMSTVQKADNQLKARPTLLDTISTIRWTNYQSRLMQDLNRSQIKVNVALKALSYTKPRLVWHRNHIQEVDRRMRYNEQKRIRTADDKTIKALSDAVSDTVARLNKNHATIQQALIQADQDAQIEVERREQERKLHIGTPFIARL